MILNNNSTTSLFLLKSLSLCLPKTLIFLSSDTIQNLTKQHLRKYQSHCLYFLTRVSLNYNSKTKYDQHIFFPSL
jgi:hypothetical protein